jgi:L-ascorbate metabolism protein UlaG (beta-lactamase superfamily)
MRRKIPLRTRRLLLTLLVFAGLYPGHALPQKNTALYLGNEAVLVTSGDQKVLFDPFFHNGYRVYQLVPEEITRKIFAGTPPFDDINAVFVSHSHGDHFAADMMLKYMQTNQQVKFVAPEQAVKLLLALPGSEDVAARITSVKMGLGDALWRATLGGLEVEAVRIPHAGWPGRANIENIVFRVQLNESQSVTHLGDADVNGDHYRPYERHWHGNETDLAFPPYWFLESTRGRKILKEQMNTNTSIGIHVPIETPEALTRSGEDFFSIPGESRDF